MKTEWSEALVCWFDSNCRSLPWRDDPTPYRVMVSEFMCQQTQIATVLPYFARFMERFPSLKSLAEASVDDVLKLWEGLGYYSRARHLHQCAQKIQAAGEFPRAPEELSSLPGIGNYTAAAISSIAFGARYPVVDGNVLRIRTRMMADDEPIDGDRSKKKHYELLLPVIGRVSDPSHFNQSMMELGALICHPSRPRCDCCPVSAWCQAYQAGNPLDYPRKKPKPTAPHYHVAVALIYDGARFLIVKRGEEQMLGGLWEFPGGKLEPGECAADAAVREVREETGLKVKVVREIALVRHAYSHFSITMHAFRCVLADESRQVQTERPYRWILPEEREKYTFPKANHKIFDQMDAQDDR